MRKSPHVLENSMAYYFGNDLISKSQTFEWTQTTISDGMGSHVFDEALREVYQLNWVRSCRVVSHWMIQSARNGVSMLTHLKASFDLPTIFATIVPWPSKNQVQLLLWFLSFPNPSIHCLSFLRKLNCLSNVPPQCAHVYRLPIHFLSGTVFAADEPTAVVLISSRSPLRCGTRNISVATDRVSISNHPHQTKVFTVKCYSDSVSGVIFRPVSHLIATRQRLHALPFDAIHTLLVTYLPTRENRLNSELENGFYEALLAEIKRERGLSSLHWLKSLILLSAAACVCAPRRCMHHVVYRDWHANSPVDIPNSREVSVTLFSL